MSATKDKTTSKTGENPLITALREQGMPEHVLKHVPQELLDAAAEEGVETSVTVVRMDRHGNGGHHDCPRVQITDHPDAPRGLGDRALGNLELITTMILAWLSTNEEEFRKFRRFGMKTAREATLAARARGDERSEEDEHDGIALFASLSQDNMQQFMHWLR